MNICYICEFCEAEIATLEISSLEKQHYEMEFLTSFESGDIIKSDAPRETIYVRSVCNDCLRRMGGFSIC